MILEILLPRTDKGVLVQVVATLVAAPSLVIWLVRRGWAEMAWLAAGVITLWVALMALRTMH